MAAAVVSGPLKKPGAWFAVASAGIFLTYALTFSSGFVSGDNIVQYYQTTQMLDAGRLSFSTSETAGILARHDWGLNTRFAVNRDGVTFSQIYGIGQSLPTIPPFVVARIAKRLAGAQRPSDAALWCLSWLSFCTACAALTMMMCRLLEARAAWSALITFAAAFGSPLWMYSAIPYNVVGETLLVFCAIVICLRIASRRPMTRAMHTLADVGWAGCLVLGVFTRQFAATAVPAFLVWMMTTPRAETAYNDAARPIVRHAAALAMLGAGAALYGAFNWTHFGSPFVTSYAELTVVRFDGPWLTGALGTFLGPLKSPFYFFPIVILFPPALGLLIWKRDAVALFAAIYLAPQLYLMPKYVTWDGGPDLSARFWLRVVPIVLLAIGAATRHLPRGRGSQAAALSAAVVLTLLGARAQMLTALTDERAVYSAAVSSLSRESDEREALAVRASVGALLIGDTVVAREQISALRQQVRPFFLFRAHDRPGDRIPLLIATMIISAVGAFGYFLTAKGPSQDLSG